MGQLLSEYLESALAFDSLENNLYLFDLFKYSNEVEEWKKLGLQQWNHKSKLMFMDL